RLEDVVVLDDERVRREVGVVLRGRFFERLPKDEELELARKVEGEAGRRGALDLALQDTAGRHLDRRARLLVDEVAQDQRRLFEPRDIADRREVGLRGHVAVSLVPAGE